MSNDAFDLMNDLLDMYSNQKQLIFCIQEIFHNLTSGTYQYTIGPGGSVGATITGSISGTTLTVTAVSSGALSVGQLLTGTGITSGTAITSYGTGFGGSSTAALGTYQLNLTNTFSSGTITTAPPRPLRINSAIVRVTTNGSPLDYPVAVITSEEYEMIGLKTLNGPWPRALYYQPTMPVGTLTYWPNPNQSGEMHLFADTVLNQFNTLTDTVTLPQGYKIFLRWNLAEALMPEYPVASGASQETRALIPEFAAQSRAWLKRTNMQPVQTIRFDDVIVKKNSRDAGWIMHGGFL